LEQINVFPSGRINMNLYLSESMIANAFWTQLLASSCASEADTIAQSIVGLSNETAKAFPTKTGTMSLESTKMLWLLGRYFSPKVVIEVGTYIGRSTAAIYMGALPSVEKFYTCDATHNAWEPRQLASKEEIEYFGKTTSTQMFERLASRGVKADFFFFDGRLQDADVNLIKMLSHDKSVFVLDDFEGLEKGVLNGIKLREISPSLILLRGSDCRAIGLEKPSSLALLIPPQALELTRQQTLPIRMM